ncbi:hypothetical protein [Undibacterium sp. Di24W]|uniref:hypothetical protein n=1 Tax=Undibacterium sp. Di24W TaxID=3413033 RepID=UPI003BF1B094
MNIPESMKSELVSWNDGAGVSLQTWAESLGTFSLAVGYTTIFWPEFVEFEGYLLFSEFSQEALRGFERQPGSTRKSVEWVMNHFHIAHLHCGATDLTKDKIIYLGTVIKEIYEAKLKCQFPDRPCTVEFYVPDDSESLWDYQLSFWQNEF